MIEEPSQLERARLDTPQTWRTRGMVCLVLLSTGVGAVAIPFILVVTLIKAAPRRRHALTTQTCPSTRTIPETGKLVQCRRAPGHAGFHEALAGGRHPVFWPPE